MNATDLAWVTGLFEGEGMITAQRSSGRKRQTSYVVICRVAMTDEQIVRLLHTSWPGSLYRAHRPKRPEHRPDFIWQVNGTQAHRFLAAILPYVKSDRVRAKAMLALAFPARPRTGRRLPSSTIATQAALAAQMRELNRKGPPAAGNGQAGGELPTPNTS